MKFSAVFAAFALAGAVMAQSETSSAPTSSVTQVLTEEIKCLKTCKEGDVACQAKCLNNPNPNEDDANATTKCVGECDQGDGTDAGNAAYGKCVQACIDNNFFSSVPAGSQPTESSTTGGSKTDAAEDAKETVVEGGKNATDEAKGDSAGASKTVAVSVMGAAALFAAALVL